MTLTTPSARRRPVFLAAASLACFTLAACGGSGSGSTTAPASSAGGAGGSTPAAGAATSAAGNAASEPKEFTFTFAVANPKETYWETLAKDFEAANPGVKIKLNKIALNAADQTIPTQLQAGNGPDVFWINAGSGQQASVGQLAKAGLLLQLPDSVYSSIPKEEMAGYDYNGAVYGIPASTQVLGYIWNDELAKATGVNVGATSTVEDIVGQCQAARAKGKTVFGLAGSIPQNTGIMTAQIAVSTVYGENPNWNADRAAGKTTFAATPGWKQALQSVIDLNKAGCFQDGAAGAGFDALTNGAATGKLFGFFAPSGAAKDIMEGSGGRAKLVVHSMPAPKGVKPIMTVSSNTGLAASKATKSPTLVAKFLAFAVTPDEAKKLADNQGGIPIGATSSTQLLTQYEPVKTFLGGSDIRPFPVDSWPNGKVYNALGTGVTGLLTGQKTIDDVLKAMDAAWG